MAKSQPSILPFMRIIPTRAAGTPPAAAAPPPRAGVRDPRCARRIRTTGAPEADRVFYEGDRVRGLWDAFPVSPGHALLIPRRHVATWFDASVEEQRDLTSAIDVARRAILERYTPDGFNIGVNVGEAGGQTVTHLHVHVIPRYRGDVADPRGGVRGVIPGEAALPCWRRSHADRGGYSRRLVLGRRCVGSELRQRRRGRPRRRRSASGSSSCSTRAGSRRRTSSRCCSA